MVEKQREHRDKTTSQQRDGVAAALLNQVNCVNYMRLASICVGAASPRCSTLTLPLPQADNQLYSTAYTPDLRYSGHDSFKNGPY